MNRFARCLRAVIANQNLTHYCTCLQPRLEERAPPERLGLHEDHAAPRDGGRRRDREVLDLKHHRHRVAELDDLRVGQTELLVVVKHSVHVFNPLRVVEAGVGRNAGDTKWKD